jgi:hypothetical protein
VGALYFYGNIQGQSAVNERELCGDDKHLLIKHAD